MTQLGAVLMAMALLGMAWAFFDKRREDEEDEF